MHTSRLADQRGIPVDNDDDLFRDQDTARDARNAVEQVISHVYPEADDRERDRCGRGSRPQLRDTAGKQSAGKGAIDNAVSG